MRTGDVDAGDAPEQAERFVGRHHAERAAGSAVEADEPGAAGDERARRRVAWQQVSHLLGRGRVVEHEQHPPTGDAAPPGRGTQFGIVGHVGVGDPDSPEQAGERFRRRQRLGARRVAPQVEEDLAVGKLVDDRVRCVQRERGLADPGHAVDGDDRFAAERGRQLGPFLVGGR